jgi:hypothetical protein
MEGTGVGRRQCLKRPSAAWWYPWRRCASRRSGPVRGRSCSAVAVVPSVVAASEGLGSRDFVLVL